MSRTASMTPQEAEAALAKPRGHLYVSSQNRELCRKWLVAMGVPSLVANGLNKYQMAQAYNDTSDAVLGGLKNSLMPPAHKAAGETVVPFVPAVAAAQTPADAITAAIRSAIESLVPKASGIDAEAVKKIVRDELPNLIPITRLEIVSAGSTKVIEGLHHRLMPVAMACVMANVPLLLVGPAGSGKSTAGEQIAEALGLMFGLQGAASGTHEYLGYKDGAGQYHSTPFRARFEMGGLFMAEEIDSGSADVPLILNAGLANGHMAFPDSTTPIKRHPDFRIIANANTFLTGADRVYVGRTQLDGATIDRFAFLAWDYDESLELAAVTGVGTGSKPITITPIPNFDAESWVKRIQALRAAAVAEKARLIISPRASINGAKLIAAGIPRDMVESMVIWKGCDDNLRRRIEARA